ncbi:MAG: M28 family peptidase [Treponema sp.]|nr:M28 family peptidase [Treponema sp.]
MYVIPQEFKNFISPDCNRAQFIQDYLSNIGLECPVLQIEGKNHLYVKFPHRQYDGMFKIKTVLAHYDRIGCGANDNSAAVFCLLQWAQSLAAMPGCHNVRLVFTDGEELGSGGVEEQGAFALAKVFKRLGITNDDVFVFDCMGRGDVPILAQTQLSAKVSSDFAKAFNALEQRAQKLIQQSAGGKWFSLPCSWSDNAGFIANGIPAVAITMLPSSEVNEVLSGGRPLSWQLLHTPQDNFESLTSVSFEIFYNILNNLARQKTLAI